MEIKKQYFVFEQYYKTIILTKIDIYKELWDFSKA